MKLMIDIDENDYELLNKTGITLDLNTVFHGKEKDREMTFAIFSLTEALKNGTPVSTDGDLISREALKEHKFVGNKFVQIGGRTNGKTIENINKAYQQGWNDCIDAIIDNAPTFDITKNQAYDQGFITAMKLYSRPQGQWIPSYVNFTDGSKPLFAYCKCSLCNKQATGVYKFCPNCGAEMVGGES